MENRTFPFFLSKKGKEKQTEEKAEKLAEKASTIPMWIGIVLPPPMGGDRPPPRGGGNNQDHQISPPWRVRLSYAAPQISLIVLEDGSNSVRCWKS